MFINIPFPNFKSEISKEYKLVVADHNSIRKQRKYAVRIMVFIHYLLCFGFSCKMCTLPSQFIKSLFWFLGFSIGVFLLVFSLHHLLHCLFYPKDTWEKDCHIGFYKLIPYCYCKKELNKVRLILAASFPFVLLTILPLIIIKDVSLADVLLYAVAYDNAILSAFDFYDIYILLKKVQGWKTPIIKSANRYFTVLKNEIEQAQQDIIV